MIGSHKNTEGFLDVPIVLFVVPFLKQPQKSPIYCCTTVLVVQDLLEGTMLSWLRVLYRFLLWGEVRGRMCT